MRLASYWIPEMESAYAAFREGGDVEGLGARLKESLDHACARAARGGYASEEVQNALYATVAWIDEQAMSLDWAGAGAWRLSPLQRHYFSTTRAGVGFFNRLRDLPEDAVQVREVFALMLVAGFQGDFAHRPAADLAQFRTELLERVAQENDMAPLGGGHPLFPGMPVPGARSAPRRGGPSIPVILLLVVPLLILLALYVYLNTQLMHEVTQVISPLTKGL